jgi:hypothetical protein
MSGAYELQNAIYNALDGDATVSGAVVGIYDNPTQVNDPSDDSEFPFLTISDTTIQPWDDDTDSGTQADATIHVWSRARHALEAKQIQGYIYERLHRGTISINGYTFVGCDLVDQDVQRDEDGITRHGIQTFRLTYYEEA